MTFFEKCLIFSVFIALTYGRSLSLEKNIFEISQSTNCSCDLRYYKHYESKGCFVEIADSCGCPQKFTCPSNQTQQAPAKVCVHHNKEYKVGSKIITSDVCQVCRCRDGIPPYISCVTRECPEIDHIPDKDCHLVFKENKCCPVGVECFESETEITRNKTCEYNGRYYPFGSKIYPIDDPCQTCICDENWNGVDNSTCYQQDCMFDKNKRKFDAGCIPVYHENLCCPIEFYCPSSHNLSYSVLSSNESSDNYNVSSGNQCTFAGQFYALNEELFINNPCIKCSCVVPPDFTCVHQTCPQSPSEENCYAVYSAGDCCPSYECMLSDAEPPADGCPTPLCADSSCRIEIPPGHECPTCVCDEKFSELEHNNLEQIQQVQQISQNMDQIEPVQHVFIPNESSEDELQMMPIRMQDSNGQSSVSEKMILPDADSIDQYAEVLGELEGNSVEDNSSTEAVSTELENVQATDKNNSSPSAETELSNTYNESITNQTEKFLQKRSDVSDAANNQQTRAVRVGQREFFQEDMPYLNEDIEREGGESERNGDFDDELESFRNKIFDKNKTIINEIIKINHVVKVPPGCPTPMCEGPWCKIGIPPGSKCPTCICKRHIDSEP